MRCSLEVNSRKHVSIENKQHQHQLKGWVTATQPLNWPKDSQKHDLDPWDFSQVSRSKVAIEQVRFRNELYKLAPWLVKTMLISMNWARSPQQGTWWTGPLTRKKLCSKVWFDQVVCHRPLAQLTLWLEKTMLKSIKWPVYMLYVHLWIDQGFSFLAEIMMKTKRF